MSPILNPAPTFAIVPVKALARAKRRLAPVLDRAARGKLALTMLDDVLLLLAASTAIDRIVIVTADEQVPILARHRGAHVIRERRPYGLNAAIRSGLAYARAEGAGRALVLPADVPLATASELSAVLETASNTAKPQAVIVPSADSSGTGAGTNALLLSPADAMQPAFGRDSFVRHVAQAVALGLDFRVLRLPGLGADIDEPRDLARLPVERYAFLGAGRAQPEHKA